MAPPPVHAWIDQDGALLRLRLARPKANVLDAAMIAAMDAEGSHFSFGASVEEHLPDACAAMLRDFHALLLRLLAAPLPVLFAVRGQCLGGGLELAATGTRIFAAPDAMLGQPEIRLGVFAPAASCLLPERIGPAAAEDLLLSGRSLTAAQAFSIGLVQDVADDPEAAAVAWFAANLADKSAAALRCAMQAARGDRVERARRRLMELEAIYLNELMRTRNALEGLTAFLERRPPHWEHR